MKKSYEASSRGSSTPTGEVSTRDRKAPRVKHVSTSSLSPDPLNQNFGKALLDQVFLNSIRNQGIVTPLLITKDKVVLDGHNPLRAARAMGIKTLPVTIASEMYVAQLEYDQATFLPADITMPNPVCHGNTKNYELALN